MMSTKKLKTGTDLVPLATSTGSVVRASVHGDINVGNSTELRGVILDVLLRPKPKELILDLSQVSYMDSSAMAVLVEALQKMRKDGGKITLANLQPRVRGVLEIAKLDTIFTLTGEN